jgi:tRNA pseudouridine55 synthase
MNGIINIYKEKGFTSFDVVAKMRGIAHQKKIGHTGTLDPDAEGVLPVCLGKATKVCDLLTDKDKEYEAVLLLGVETDTQDISGTVLRESEVHVTEEQVRKAVHSFVGKYEQVPPMYSALKVGGQKLCDLARKGITVDRKAREVEIFAIDIISMDIPRIKLEVHCSKGTYIRTLCQDIGEKLGCYGCMESLLRTRVAQFRIEDALRLSEVEQYFADGNSDKILCPVDSCFMQYPAIFASAEADKLLNNGNRIPEPLVLTGDTELSGSGHGESGLQSDTAEDEHGTFRMYNAAGSFIGIYTWNQEQRDYKPIKIFMGQD